MSAENPDDQSSATDGAANAATPTPKISIDHTKGAVVGDYATIIQNFYAESSASVAPAAPGSEPAPGQPPYMGLRFFDTRDAGLFYGRETLSRELCGRLSRERFLAVVGASGSGKSSLVRAGLVPLWQQAELPGFERQDGIALSGPVHVITPTARPLESLAASLTRHSESVTATATLIDDLKKDPRSLHLYARKLLASGGAGGAPASHLLLVIDQFEETFTLCKDLKERRTFVENLLAATADESGGPLRVVLTLRADFYHHCAEYPGLRQALQIHQAYIGAMSREELRQAIEAPALRATPETGGPWEFDEGLVDLILQDVGEEPGALPLLSHALLETWKRREGRTMTLAGYTAAGGVRKAIALTAESVYGRLPPEAQTIARRIFLRLTELGEGVQDTRRRARLAELSPDAQQQEAVQAVLQILADARLVTTDQEAAEVAHEALIREWPTLQRWLDENRDDLRLHRKLSESVMEWWGEGQAGRDTDLLYRGARLEQALELAEQHPDWLNAPERAFLDASREAQLQAEAEAEAARRRELEQAQRLAQTQRQRSLILAAGLAVAVVLIFLATWFFRQSQNHLYEAQAAGTQAAGQRATAESERATAVAAQALAETQKRLALARQLSVQAKVVLEEEYPEQVVPVLLAVESLLLDPAPEAQQVLYRSRLVPQAAVMAHDGAVNDVAYSPDGRLVVTGSSDGTARAWDAKTGEEIAGVRFKAPVQSVAVSPDGRLVVAGSFDNTAVVWEAQTGKEIARLPHGGGVWSVAFSPGGRHVATGSADGSARVWELFDGSNRATGRQIARMTQAEDVGAVAFSPDGRSVVSGGFDDTAVVWEALTGKEIARLSHRDNVRVVAFSPNGRYVVTGSADHTARVWEAQTGRLVTSVTHSNMVSSVAFSPDSGYVVSGGFDGTAKVWDVSEQMARQMGKEGVARMTRAAGVWAVTFSPDGQFVASGSDDGTAQVWEAQTGREVARMTHSGIISSLDFSPDGQWLVTGSFDGTARIWRIQQTGEAAGAPEGLCPTQQEPFVGVIFSPDCRYFAAWKEGSRVVTLHEAAGGREIARLAQAAGSQAGAGPGPADAVVAVAFSPDSRWVVSGGVDTTSRVWEAATGKEIAHLAHEDAVASVAFAPTQQAPDRYRVASGSYDNTAVVWEFTPAAGTAAGREIARLMNDGAVRAVAFSPDGRYVVTGGFDGTARVWSVGSGKEIARMEHAGDVGAVAYSPDGSQVASASRDGVVMVWNAQTGKEIARLGHTETVRAVAFDPTGRPDRQHVLTVSGYLVRVWEIGAGSGAAGGREVARIPLDETTFRVAFSGDGRYILAGVRSWPWQIDDLIDQACQRLPRNLTRAEWQRYIGETLPYQAVCPDLPVEP